MQHNATYANISKQVPIHVRYSWGHHLQAKWRNMDMFGLTIQVTSFWASWAA